MEEKLLKKTSSIVLKREKREAKNVSNLELKILVFVSNIAQLFYNSLQCQP